MARLVTTASRVLAERTSRRGFLARCGQMIFAVVGGSALLTLMAHPAAAQRRCRCERPCPAWMTCGCGGERGGNLEIHWHCPSCGDYRCEYYQCTDRRCR